MKHKDIIIDAEEEVVDMEKGDNGTYHPVAVIKVRDKYNRSIARNDAIRDINPNMPGMPKWFPPAYEVLSGFISGMGAIENFMLNVKKMNRRGRNG